MPNGERLIDERVASLESAVATIGDNVKTIAAKVDTITRTPWSHIIGFAAIVLTIVGAAYAIYSRDQERHEVSIAELHTSDIKLDAKILDASDRITSQLNQLVHDLDSNLQREQRQLDDRIIEKVDGLKELRAQSSADMDARLTTVESMLRQGFNERWSKADHIEYDRNQSAALAAILRRIERLEEFHLQSAQR